MWRPSSRTVFVLALIVLVLGSVALTHYAFTPSPVTGRHPDLTPRYLFLPSAAAVCLVQVMSFPSLRHRLTASAVLFCGGTLATLVIGFVVGCGFYGACSK